MNNLFYELCNADAIASNEYEVRDLLYKELRQFADDVYCDKLGSLIFHKKGRHDRNLKIMITAHMDEVGFMVRHIDEYGFIYLHKVGGSLDKGLNNQLMRITTFEGEKIVGYMNLKKDIDGKITDYYLDIAAFNQDEVKRRGVAVGNMVTFNSVAQDINGDVIAAKAIDDRVGCYVLAELIKETNLENDVYFVMSSSEEVGMRGAKTSASLIEPDVIFAIDVANNHEMDHSFKNHRKIGHGIMLEHYDKTMSPNIKLVELVKKIAIENKVMFQEDMFGNGGTDAGYSHLVNSGSLAMVLGVPLRYCHTSYSYVHKKDVESMIKLLKHLVSEKKESYMYCLDYLGGKNNDRN